MKISYYHNKGKNNPMYGKHHSLEARKKIMIANTKNLIGMKFGRLLILENTNEHQHTHVIWLCKCECGKIIKVPGNRLTGGNTKSCGCLRKEIVGKMASNNIKHGDCRKHKWSSLYKVWIDIKRRCFNHKKLDYKYYGGRGITLCFEWKNNYLAFKIWAFSHGYKKGLTIHRIDNNGNYEPSNCQWITQSENSKKAWENRRLCQQK
jgi:hypothetical protein